MVRLISVSKTEKDLLEAVVWLKYGELLSVEIPSGPRTEMVDATETNVRLIRLIRSEGVACLERIKVVDGEAVQIETCGVIGESGFRFIRKFNV